MFHIFILFSRTTRPIWNKPNTNYNLESIHVCSPLSLFHPLFTFGFGSPFVHLWVCFTRCSALSLFHPLFTFQFVSPFVYLCVCFTLCSPLSLFTLCSPFNLFHLLFTLQFVSASVHLSICFTPFSCFTLYQREIQWKYMDDFLKLSSPKSHEWSHAFTRGNIYHIKEIHS